MTGRCVWLFCLVLAVLELAGCAPRYTAVVEKAPPEAIVPQQVQAALSNATSVYEAGVDFFVKGQYDSASSYLDRALSLLGQDAGWSASSTVLSERRLLVYKCRYFLERIPATVAEAGPEADLDAIRPLKPQLPPIEIVDNDKVQRWIRYFNYDVRDNFQEWITRSGKYRPLTLRILKEEGVPLELTNLAMIESGFNPNAYSRAHAAGIWQFIKSTGHLYGLKVDSYVDERRDPEKSCRAAARHLRDLYEIFDSWPLAMAAYNSGAGNVGRAIKRNGTTDYWRLSLKRETRDYVPMFMAAAIIMSDPAQYGFECRYEAPMEFETIQVEGRTDFKAIARSCQVEPAVICELNPQYTRHCTPDGSASTVRIPKGSAEGCVAELARIPKAERTVETYVAANIEHKVKRGETLSRIAKKYGTTVVAIADANGIKNYRKIRTGQVLAIPGADYHPSTPENPGIHTVRRGETLSGISAKYAIKMDDLLAWNDIKSRDLLQTGQKLVVSGREIARDRVIVHKVRKGDTINGIAGKYGATTGNVLKTNGLKPRDKIFPGQKIKVPVRANT